jgi:transposase
MLDDLWADGFCNRGELHRQLCDAGFKGSLRVATEWATRKRQEQKSAKTEALRKAPSARTVAKMMTTHCHGATTKQIELLTVIAKATLNIVTTRDQLDTFHEIIRNRQVEALTAWMAEAEDGPLSSFVTGLRADAAAVEAAIREKWSSGQVESMINKLKLLKRQMYGRDNLDLLEARLMSAA